MADTEEIQTLVTRLTADNLDLRSKLTESQKLIANFGKDSQSILRGALAFVGGLGIDRAIGEMKRSYMDFNSAFTESTARAIGLTESQRESMKQLARTLSTESTFSATELVKAYNALDGAGLSVEQQMNALRPVMDFATASRVDLAHATEMVTEAQQALGLRSKDANINMTNMRHVMDVLTRASQISASSTSEFADALNSKTASALRLVDKEMEEGAAVLAAYASQGAKGSVAGMRLTLMLKELQAASRDNTKEWNSLGLRLYDATGRMLPIADIIESLNSKLSGMSGQQRSATLSMLGFSERTRDAVTSLFGMSEKIRFYESSLKEAAGATQSVAENQMKTMEAQLAKNRHAWDALIQEMTGPAIIKGTTFTINIMTQLQEQLKGMDQGTKETIGYFALLGGEAVSLAGKATGVLTMLKLLGFEIKLLNKEGLASMYGHLGKLGPAVAVVGTAFAGWEVGKFLGEIEEVNDALAWMFNKLGLVDKVKSKEAEGGYASDEDVVRRVNMLKDQYNRGDISAEDYHKRVTLLQGRGEGGRAEGIVKQESDQSLRVLTSIRDELREGRFKFGGPAISTSHVSIGG